MPHSLCRSGHTTAFFVGLALDGKAWDPHSQKLTQPLRTYGFIELGVNGLH